MTTELLKNKKKSSFHNQSVHKETTPVQNWFSFSRSKQAAIPVEKRTMIENEIVNLVQAYVVTSRDLPKQEAWWKKIVAL